MDIDYRYATRRREGKNGEKIDIRCMFLPRNVAAKPRQYARPYEGRESETEGERESERSRSCKGWLQNGSEERKKKKRGRRREAGRKTVLRSLIRKEWVGLYRRIEAGYGEEWRGRQGLMW